MTIKAFLGLEDKMTPVLSKAEKQAIANLKAYNQLKKEVEELDKAWDDLYDAGLKDSQMADDIIGALVAEKEAMNEYADGTRNAKIEQDDLQQSATELNQQLELLKKAWSALSSVIQEANKWMELSDEDFNSQFTAAVKMHSILGANDEEIQSMYDYASALQEVGVVGDEVTVAGMSELSMYASNLEQVRKLTPAILDLAVAQNGLDTNMSNVESTASMVGRALSGSSMMLKRQLGLTDKQVKALDSMTDKGQKAAAIYGLIEHRVGGANQALAQTAQGGIMQAKNSLGDLGETMGRIVTPYFAAFEQALVQLVTPIVEFVSVNADWLIPTLLTVAAVIGILMVVFTIWSVVNWITSASVWAVLSPILLTMAIILLIIGAIVLLCKWVSDLTGRAVSAVGTITGMIAALGAFFFNEFLVPIQNATAAFGNFFANFMKDPVASIKILILDLARVIVDKMNTVAEVIDSIFGTNLSAGTRGFLRKLDYAKEEIKKASAYEEVFEAWDKVDYGDAIKAGYEFGENIQNGVSNGFGGFNIKDTLSSLDSIMGTDMAGEPALKTTSKDNLLKDEDIQLLLDIATRDFKLDYQQITPQITLTFGDVHETADVDGIIEEIVTELEEVYDSNLEVVPAE